MVRACVSDKRALVSLDIGFADILAYPPAEHPKFVVLRLSNQAQPAVLGAIQSTVRLLEPAKRETVNVISGRNVDPARYSRL
jgi:hypothetical protein